MSGPSRTTSNDDSTDDLIAFVADLPHWVADAGLSPEDATTAADLLDRLVETLQSAGYPPVDVDGPDPDSFPPPTDRIAAAATQCEGLMRGLDPAGWQTEVGDQSIAEHTQHAVTHLRSMTTDS